MKQMFYVFYYFSVISVVWSQNSGTLRDELTRLGLLLDPYSYQPQPCNRYYNGQYYGACPQGYNCVNIQGYLGTYCCQQYQYQQPTKMVCPNYEFPFYPTGSNTPLTCVQNVLYACPYPYQCQYSDFYSRYICCKPY